jgi:uncharacterized protein (UPF0276 family)
VKHIDGVGLGLRQGFAQQLLATTRRAPDFLEIIPENWMFAGGHKARQLDEFAERYPIVPHSVSLNVGGVDPLDATFLDASRALGERLEAPFASDHVCWASVDGRPLHDLLPLPFTEEAADNLGVRAREASRRLERPLVLENATYYVKLPGDPHLDEAAFLTACLERSGCELLLDVNNVYVNSLNHGFDAQAFIDRLPLERVRYLHLAGHTRRPDGVVIDTHIGPIIQPVWQLYAYVLKRAGKMLPTLIEWDQDIPPLDEVLDEVDRARAVASEALAS